MLFKNLLKSPITFFVAAIFLFSFQAFSQEPAKKSADYTDEEIKGFIEANKEASLIQQKTQEEMLLAIEKENIEVEKFNEILEAKQKDAEVEASIEDAKAFDKAMENLVVIQEKMDSEIEEVIEKNLGVTKYQEMMLVYQQDPDFQQRVNSLL